MTRIKRDQKIPIIGFVANTGGLLGLCMGFSLVSAFEIVYHCMMTLCWKSFRFMRRQTMRHYPPKIQQELGLLRKSQEAAACSRDHAHRAPSEKFQEIGTISQTLTTNKVTICDDDLNSSCRVCQDHNGKTVVTGKNLDG